MVKKRQGENIFGLHLGKIYKLDNRLYMIDELQNTYPIESLIFVNKYFNTQEGDLEYPRIWENKTEAIKETTGKTEPKEGDIVLFGFIGGSGKYPVILGSTLKISLFGDKYRSEFAGFLDMQEARHLIKENIKRKIELTEDKSGNFEKTITTYEDIENDGDPKEERGSCKLTVGKDGEIAIDLVELAEMTGTGNITLNLKGNDGQTNGNINVNFNGKLSLINTDDEGVANGNKIVIDNTDGEEKILVEDKHGNKYNSTKDGTVFTDVNGNTYTNNADGIKLEDKDGNIIEFRGATLSCLPKTMLNLGKAAAIAVNNFPACLFTGAPHSTSADVKA